MNCLLVTAHPLQNSLNARLAGHAEAVMTAGGHQVIREDLYRSGFSAALTGAERQSYYAPAYDDRATAAEIARLRAAEALVLCFPTWWFGFPAQLKGWFDRVWAPGVAYDHAEDGGLIRPRLTGLRHVLAVTTLGSPWWVDRLVMRRPVARVLRTGILRPCAPQAGFRMLSLYQAEAMEAGRLARFEDRMAQALRAWP